MDRFKGWILRNVKDLKDEMPKKENKFASIYRCLLMHDMVDCSNAQKLVLSLKE